MFFSLKTTTGSASSLQLLGIILNLSFEILFVHRNLCTPLLGLAFTCKNIFYGCSAAWILSYAYCKGQTKETGIEAMSWMILLTRSK